MARNAIQLQKGLEPLRELNASYGSEEKCAAAIFKWRWPGWVRVPGLRQREPRYRRRARAISVPVCLKQTSLKSGTIFARALLPYVQMVPGHVSARSRRTRSRLLGLARQLGVRPDTAALMRHKLMSVMFEARG